MQNPSHGLACSEEIESHLAVFKKKNLCGKTPSITWLQESICFSAVSSEIHAILYAKITVPCLLASRCLGTNATEREGQADKR